MSAAVSVPDPSADDRAPSDGREFRGRTVVVALFVLAALTTGLVWVLLG